MATARVDWYYRPLNFGCSWTYSYRFMKESENNRLLSLLRWSIVISFNAAHSMSLQTAGHSERSLLPRWEVGGVQPVACSSSSDSSGCSFLFRYSPRCFKLICCQKMMKVICFVGAVFRWMVAVSVSLTNTLLFLWLLYNKNHLVFLQVNVLSVKLQQ